MFFIVRYIAKLVKALSSEAEPWQIGLGFCLGMIMGLTPLFSLHNLFFLVLLLVIKANIGMAMLGFFVCSGLAYLIDPVFHSIGSSLLHNESLRGMWTAMYANKWIALTNFYNTVVLGSLISSLVLCIPMYPLSVKFVNFYRAKIDPWLQKLWIIKALKGTKFYGWYMKISRMVG